MDVAFLHCNPRHHSIAFNQSSRSGKRLSHFMVEVDALDDVGRTWSLCDREDVPMAQSLGRHVNDQMFSFYIVSPSGFTVEFGYGGRLIDDATWEVSTYDWPSMWGHQAPRRAGTGQGEDRAVSTLWLDMLGAEVRYRGRKFKTRTIEAGEHNPNKLILIHGVGGHAEAYSRNLSGSAKPITRSRSTWCGTASPSKPPFTPQMVPTYSRADHRHLRRSRRAERLDRGRIARRLGHDVDRAPSSRPRRASSSSTRRPASTGTATKSRSTSSAARISLRERSLAAIRNPNRETIRKRLEWLMASPDRVTDELVDLRYAIYSRPDTNASLNKCSSTASAAATRRNAIEEDELAGIKAPALALWSDKNPGAGPTSANGSRQLIPGSSHYCIMDAAHWPQWEKPEEHDRVVTAFLSGTRVPAPAVPA